jgi:hypothetical protein
VVKEGKPHPQQKEMGFFFPSKKAFFVTLLVKGKLSNNRKCPSVRNWLNAVLCTYKIE